MPKPYVAHQKMFDAALPHGRHYYWKSHKLGPLTDEIIDVVVEHCEQITSPLSSVPLFSFGGAVARVPEDATAFPYRDAAHDINIVASWLPEDAGRRRPAHRLGPGLLRRPRAPQPGRLRELHQRRLPVDGSGRPTPTSSGAGSPPSRPSTTPTNFFRLNANIPPATD